MSTRRVPPRWVRWTLVTVLLLASCVTFGITTARADLALGPHEARYDVTSDSQVVVDVGPIGTLEIDSPLPFGLGIRVTVGEIPADLRTVDGDDPLGALAGDAESYLQLFSDPETTVRRVAEELVADAVQRTMAAALVVAGVGVGGYLLLGVRRREELASRLVPRTWEITAGVTVVVLVAAVVPRVVVSSTEQAPPAQVFAGTPLEGARMTGRLAGVVDTYGSMAIDLYDENEAFYAGADAELDDAWAERLHDQEIDDIARSVGLKEPDGAPADDDVLTFVVVTDLHCNTGMSPLIRTTLERSGAQVLLNAGDTTTNGTSVEDVCVSSFADAVPDGVDVVVADGNHDSVVTSEQEAAQGWRVLDGSVVDVHGMRVLGDRDALETRVGSGSYTSTDETSDEQAARIEQTACEDDDVDLLLIHTPSAGTPAMNAGCVPFQISGHLHRRIGPVQIGAGFRYVSSSTAGAASDQPTVGPLNGIAEMTVFRFDTEARRMIDLQLVEVTPAGTAAVGERVPVPALAGPGAVPVEESLEDPAPEVEADADGA
ncbi:metallophosphoesterase family protein [Paraoerskovia marina]|uniref:metallophosphoesterase family protein n=1 Tax=Paraoerskovia marina TaxID=545619 RepID=UPI0012F9F2BC|nr:metallophosphoesterase [Paraoerskovia marina]